MESYARALAKLAAGKPSDAARSVLQGDIRKVIQAYLPYISLCALNADPDAQKGACALVAMLQTLQKHPDPSLLSLACGGSAGALSLAVVAEYCVSEAKSFVQVLLPGTEHVAWLDLATAACEQAVSAADTMPWREQVGRISRAVRLSRSLVRAVDNDNSLIPSLIRLATILARLYHNALNFSRVPANEGSSSATPWPPVWLLSKVEVLTTADACIMLAQDAGAPEILQAFSTDGRHVPDAVSLVNQVLLEDLACARPECQSLLPERMAFPGAAWTAVRAEIDRESSAVDPRLIDMVQAVLPQLSREQIHARLCLAKYHTLTSEQVMEAFLDDPDGLNDISENHAQADHLESATAGQDSEAGLSEQLKASILARAQAEDTELAVDEVDQILCTAYLTHGDQLFARNDKKARARPERAALRAATNRSDDQLEDWASMLLRNPDRDQLLAQAATYVAPNLNQGKVSSNSYGADKIKGGRVPQQVSRGATRAHKRPGRGRGTGGGGRGRGAAK
ncbi:hypothetical protein MYAM1_002706 [Malassezia yamatoensis]|uniref:CUE domain-containing protein n=1 Tax=Malassezia yamatoensis TaxID=253288 RepID=A0AAJ5YTL5_9BASI|nr:hypothetical protein MYAM1_002706 [Malassezia yamatoensis]